MLAEMVDSRWRRPPLRLVGLDADIAVAEVG